ncbi:unnamed protein product [Prunus brigantina]
MTSRFPPMPCSFLKHKGCTSHLLCIWAVNVGKNTLQLADPLLNYKRKRPRPRGFLGHKGRDLLGTNTWAARPSPNGLLGLAPQWCPNCHSSQHGLSQCPHRFFGRNTAVPRSIHCVFLSYSYQHKGYRCLDPTMGRVYISRHVIFNETVFPYKQLQTHLVLDAGSLDSRNYRWLSCEFSWHSKSFDSCTFRCSFLS